MQSSVPKLTETCMAQMWPGVRPSPGADVAWGEAQSRCRCDRDEPSPGADVEWTQSASAVSHSTHALPFALMNCFFSSVARCPQAALNPRQIPYRTPSGQRAPCIGAAAQQLARRACCVGGRKTKASLLLGVPRPHARPQAVAALRGAAHRHDARPPQPAHPTRPSPPAYPESSPTLRSVPLLRKYAQCRLAPIYPPQPGLDLPAPRRHPSPSRYSWFRA